MAARMIRVGKRKGICIAILLFTDLSNPYPLCYHIAKRFVGNCHWTSKYIYTAYLVQLYRCLPYIWGGKQKAIQLPPETTSY